jgi:hypothetical protein
MATNTSRKNQASESSKPPIAKLRLGLINANIWERSTNDSVFYSVSFERRYKDAKGEWHSTHSYNAEDLLLLAKLADQAHTEIAKLRAAPDESAT